MTEVTLHSSDTDITLPIAKATVGSDGYDISKLMTQTGNVTLDPGFANTANCRSAITYIDGDEGILRYRGYPIEQLAEQSTFLEVAYLVIYGELPTSAQLERWEADITSRMMLDERMRDLYRCFPRRSHPMNILAAGVMALGAFNPATLSLSDPDQIERATYRLIGSMPALVAWSYKSSTGMPFMYPKKGRGYVGNYLAMSFGSPMEEYELDPKVVAAFETLFILHADHEQNCSTATVRMIGSADATMFAAVSGGVNALSGPLHGGANQAVLEMLRTIENEGIEPREFMNKVKDKESGIRLMGFGHRVYKNYDPRAKIIKAHADALLSDSHQNKLLDMAKELEEIALSDDYFVERKLYPNVDFYTGLIYEAMGFPSEYFTALFALGRLPGWIAQWREQQADPNRKIGRPRQVYVGEDLRDYVPITKR